MQHERSGTLSSAISASNSAASNSARLNSVTSNNATLKAKTLNSGASLIKKELLWKLNIIAIAMMSCFTTAQQSAQYVAQLTLNHNITEKMNVTLYLGNSTI